MSAATPLVGRQVLITGGLGFVGSTLARRLVALGARVRVLDSLLPHAGGSPRNVAGVEPAIEVIVEDTRNRDAVDRAIRGCDLVYHLASPGGSDAVLSDWYTQIDIACLGTLNVLESLRVQVPKARCVFASSRHVYGRAASLPVAESAPTEPDSVYGVHKLAGEKYCGVFRQRHGTDVVIARLTSVFGARQQLAGPAGTLPHVLDSGLHGEDIVLVDGGTAAQDFIYVEDAVNALVLLGTDAKASGAVVNVASGARSSLAEVARLVTDTLGRGRVVSVLGRGDGDPGFVADVARLDAMSGGAARRSLPDAIRETLDWFTGAASGVQA